MTETIGFWQRLPVVWRVCLEEAWAAYCANSIPIGAAIIDQQGAILARGRNRVFEGISTAGMLSGGRLAHAEINALLALAQSEADVKTCAMYSSMEPCPMCIGAIRMHSIRPVNYAARDPVAGSAAMVTATPFMTSGLIELHSPRDRLLESISVAMHTAFALKLKSNWTTRARELADAQYRRSLDLGQRLFETGMLDDHRARGLAADLVVEGLAQFARTLAIDE